MTEKYYTLGTHTSEQWIELHAELIADGNVYGTVPSREVDVDDEKPHSPTRGDYLLTPEEADELQSDPRVKFINLSMSRHSEEYEPPQAEVVDGTLTTRWDDDSHHWYYWSGGGTPSTFFTNAEPDINRNTSQLYRLQQKRNPWIENDRLILLEYNDTVSQRGAGENVDLICADDGTWIGHTEFINSGVFGAVNPEDYVGGNVLSSDGICDVLDLVLDSPYYMDPDWFDADSANRLMTRWDGTTVPTEAAARDWWGDSDSRSEGFNFGEINISSFYTRDRVHGSNTTFPVSGTHGTPCASQLYGRTHGWAYNANKWHLNLYGSGSNAMEVSFDIQKIFHQYKPNNSIFNTKDPTVVSNSWSYRNHIDGTHYYFNGSGPTAYTYDSNGNTGEPAFIKHHTDESTNNAFKSEMKDNSMTTAADECLEAGVIWFAAAGNAYQNCVLPDHPSYDNRIANNATDTLYGDNFSYYGFNFAGTTNRRGFPGQAGKTETQAFQGNTTLKYPVITVGALDNLTEGGNYSTGKERKVSYSDRGSAVDIFAPANGTIGATKDDSTYSSGGSLERVDNSYTGLTARDDARDTWFNGTSSACPIATGFFATIIQYNRDWDYDDIRNYIANQIDNQDSDDFYEGDDEPTTATDEAWFDDYNAIYSAQPKVAYLPSGVVPTSTPYPISQDTTAPVITINGDNPVTHERFSTYTDAGATSDGGETVSVTGLGSVDVNTVGTYLIGYFATDAAGNTGSATRTVNVVDTTAPTVNVTQLASQINEGSTSIGTATSNEQPVTWSVTGTDVSISSSGVITLNSPADFETQTSYSFTVTATDASGNAGSANVTVSVVDDVRDNVGYGVGILPDDEARFAMTDVFGRNNGLLSSHLFWLDSSEFATNSIEIVGEKLKNTTATGDVAISFVDPMRYDFNDDQEASVLLRYMNSPQDAWVGPVVRLNPVTGACYALFINGGPAGNFGPLERYDGSQWHTVPLSDTSWLEQIEGNDWIHPPYYSNVNKVTLRVIGNKITILVNNVEQVSVIDNNVTSGQPGVVLEHVGIPNYNIELLEFTAASDPIESFSDTFDRSDETVGTNSNWTSIVDGLEIRSNQVRAERTQPVDEPVPMCCLSNLSGVDQEASVVINALETQYAGPMVRANPTTGEAYIAVAIVNTESPTRAVWISVYRSPGGENGTTLGQWEQIHGLEYVTTSSGGDWLEGESHKLTLRVAGFTTGSDVYGRGYGRYTVLVDDIIQDNLIGELPDDHREHIHSGSPGIFAISQDDVGETSGIVADSFSASVLVDTYGPVNQEFYIRAVTRTDDWIGHNSEAYQDRNTIAKARELLFPSYTSSGGPNDPPSVSVSDSYYSLGYRYDYSANDDYGVDFKDDIFAFNGSVHIVGEYQGNSGVFHLPPTIAPDADEIIVMPDNTQVDWTQNIELIIVPSGMANYGDATYRNSGGMPEVTARLLDQDGNVIDPDLAGMDASVHGGQIFALTGGGVNSQSSYNIRMTLYWASPITFGNTVERWEQMKLPNQDIPVLMDDNSTQTFKSYVDIRDNDNVNTILSYPSTLNYVEVEYTIHMRYQKTGLGSGGVYRKPIVLKQRVYEHPDRVVNQLQSINTPGTGDPDNLPDLPGGD